MRILLLFFSFLYAVNLFAQNEDVIEYLNVSEFNGKVLLSWSILQGNTCNGVEILHSLDSVNFSEIGSIEGLCGSSQESIAYEYTDVAPEPNARNYYRISLGGIGFSWIVGIDIVALGNNASIVRPNPIDEVAELHFDNESNSEFSLSVYSANGIIVYSELTSSDYILLRKQVYAQGIYFYILRSEQLDRTIYGKFAVQ